MINLLIVDDEVNIVTGIRDNIPWNEYGIRVCGIAGNGAQALDLLMTTSPDIIIMDICMPQISGIELLEIINEKYPNIRTILISGFREFEYARQAVNLNAFAYISKPIDDKELLQTVLKVKEEIQGRLEKLRQDAIVTARIKENLSILKDIFLSRLVKGWYKKIDQINAHASSYDIKLDYKQFLVGLIVQDTTEEAGTSAGEMNENFRRAVILSKLDNLLPKEGLYSFNLENGIGMLFAADTINREYLYKQLNLLIKCINQEGGFSITVALGKVCKRVEDIPLSYKTAVSTLDYKVVIGNNQVIDSENFSRELFSGGSQFSFYRYLHDVEKELLIALKSINTDALNRWAEDVGEMLGHIIKNNIRQKSNAVFMLAFHLYYIQGELGIYGDHIPYGGDRIFSEISKLAGVSEIKCYLNYFLRRIIADIKSINKDQRNYLVSRAKEYICKNVHEQISLVSVADYLEIHPSYLSKIFKMITGETFTDYLTTVKMSEAERLLKTTNMRVYEISELLKYNDPGYFIKLFRKVFGVSPNEYRQLQF